MTSGSHAWCPPRTWTGARSRPPAWKPHHAPSTGTRKGVLRDGGMTSPTPVTPDAFLI